MSKVKTQMHKVKITVTGDACCGKSCMIDAYTTENYAKYIPDDDSFFVPHVQKITVDNTEYEMTVQDTPGYEEYYRLRQQMYEDTDCFLVCFSVEKESASYENIPEVWSPEVTKFDCNVPILLVGLQTDLRDNSKIACYTPKEGEELMKDIGAQGYVECSALTKQGLHEVFTEAIRLCPKKEEKKDEKKKCQIL
ncbi:hypothetical protein NQ315_016432 [Exocentrus adspersus]|uniref:Uncharacterized protein n=1 Tax=Exocentrus adspersus TaxID=1586481 RepID=A0AAV8VPE7_9CUCU|nr:hypothetical protein NQ315_016432 [Exocentrus adspersus]